MANSIQRWLEQLGLEKYASVFDEQEIDHEILFDLTEADLEKLRIPLGPRKKIIKAITEQNTARAISTPYTPEDRSPRATLNATDAERRQLTVMFCDLVDSTRLSGQLDPEDLRDVIRVYQTASADVCERYAGYIAQHLGDGLMVYFGWPRAHEDDAQRAIHAGLGILSAMQELSARLEQERGIRLVVRIGIHTGLVVVGETGQGTGEIHLAIGETPNLASRLESLAQPGTMVISDVTFKLVQGYFVCDDLGVHALKGVAKPMQIYRVIRESSIQSRLNITRAGGLTQLIGREAEVRLLMERWNQAKDGQGQVILLSGEAGIGKSRLVKVLKDLLIDTPHIPLECRSSPYHQNTALYPIIDLLQRIFHWQQDDLPEQRLAKLERELTQYHLDLEDFVPLFAALLSLPLPEKRYPPLAISAQHQRQKTLASIVSMLSAFSEQQPVLFIVEDLHWTDPSMLEILGLLIDQASTIPIFVLLTARPTFQPSWRPRSNLLQVTLNRLSGNLVKCMAEQVVGGKRLPDDVLHQIVEKTDGVPLYVEEMTKAILDAGFLSEADEHYTLTHKFSSMAIPATLHDALMARLDPLDTAKAVAQYAAVIGRQFSYKLLYAIAKLEDITLQHELRRLVESELIYQTRQPPHATYVFKHALIRDAAYQSLLRSARQDYHQRIAQVLTVQFPETVERQPELLAHHFTEAGQDEIAISYWQRAGELARQKSSYIEASHHLAQGLELLKTLPQTSQYVKQKLAMQTALATVLLPTKGYGSIEVAQAYSRAKELCDQLDETEYLFPVLHGEWASRVHRSNHQDTLGLSKQILKRAQHSSDSGAILMSERALGQSFFFTGRFKSALRHLELAVASYHVKEHAGLAFRYGIDLRTAALSHMVSPYWILGYPDKAVKVSEQALAHAEIVKHENSMAHTLVHAGTFHEQFRNNPVKVQKHARYLATLSEQGGFQMFLAWCHILEGWALFELGDKAQGLSLMRTGISNARRSGSLLYQPYFLALLAQSYGKLNQVREGLRAVHEALEFVEANNERWYEAEVYRIKGMLVSQSENNGAATEQAFNQALTVARQQSAKSLELRSAMSLARLWHKHGKRHKAHDLLASVSHWFTEGFDTNDLKDARTLLDELEVDQ